MATGRVQSQKGDERLAFDELEDFTLYTTQEDNEVYLKTDENWVVALTWQAGCLLKAHHFTEDKPFTRFDGTVVVSND